MAFKIAAVVFAALALMLNFRGAFILKNVFKKDEYSDKDVMRLKIAALIFALAAFITVFRV